MSNTVPQQQSHVDAARSDDPSAPPADRPLPEFQPHTPIEREIERSERASAALAATRALARAAFTDSQLAAADAADAVANSDADIDTPGWIRTEYAALDQTVAPRATPVDEPRGGANRNLIGGSFNPGIASQHGRSYAGASMAHASIRTRTGAQARFMQESRQTPRVERVASTASKLELSQSAGIAHYDKPAVIPMLAAPIAAPAPRPVAATPARSRAVDTFKFALTAGLGAAVVLVAGGVAWKAGLLSRSRPADASTLTPPVAAQAEAESALSASPQEIAVTPPAAGPTPSTRSDPELDATLAAAARAAAVPMASVHAAGPARVARAPAPDAAPVTVVATTTTTAPAGPQHAAAPHGKDGVAAAIANAQARADSFLAAGSGTPAAATELKKSE